jgi:hypothetical protein
MSKISNDLSFLNKTSENKYAYYQDVENNETKLNQQIVNSCSSACFQNLKTDFIINSENLCLTKCFKKYMDSLHLGEQIYEGLNKKTLSSAHLATGKFDQFLTDAQKDFDL